MATSSKKAEADGRLGELLRPAGGDQQGRTDCEAGVTKSALPKPYEGLLATPMPRRTALSGPTEEEFEALLDTKLKALFAHFELDPAEAFEAGPKMASAWANLAYKLACQHVDGFKGAPARRGAPATRKQDDVVLVMHIELLKRRNGLSDRAAIRTIVEQKLVSGTFETLRKRYQNAKRVFEPISAMFDRMTFSIGKDRFLSALERALSGEEKNHFVPMLSL